MYSKENRYRCDKHFTWIFALSFRLVASKSLTFPMVAIPFLWGINIQYFLHTFVYRIPNSAWIPPHKLDELTLTTRGFRFSVTSLYSKLQNVLSNTTFMETYLTYTTNVYMFFLPNHAMLYPIFQIGSVTGLPRKISTEIYTTPSICNARL